MDTNNIPFYYATIEDLDTGIASISLVDQPAVEVDFLKFNKVQQLYTINEQKHCLTGVIMLADTPIYRLDSNNKPYYIVYTKEVIKQMAIKMLNQDKTYDNIDTEHNGVLLKSNDLQLIEIFIKDSSKGIDTEFNNIPDGSLIATYKVNNTDIWNKCLNGTYNGFSLSGMFNLSQIQDKSEISKFTEKIKSKNMNFNSILKKVLLKYSEVTTTDGTVWVLDGELTEGATPVDTEGNQIPDGTYTVDSQTVTIKDGTVESIATETKLEDDPTYATTADVESLKSEIATLKAMMEDLQAKLSVPVAEPITEEYSKVNNTPLNGAARFLTKIK
jgi:hypothetical protein